MIIAKAIQNERTMICNQCDEFMAMTNMCRKCGCLIRLKVKFQAAKCPLGKWEEARKRAHQAELARQKNS
jgi:hypothetical protein